jgi:uncharacterized protein (DUF433 family)
VWSASVSTVNIERIIIRDDDILGGTPVFAGTHVPAQTPLDYLEAGQPLDAFLDDFPTVRREQAAQLLRSFKQALFLIDQPENTLNPLTAGS